VKTANRLPTVRLWRCNLSAFLPGKKLLRCAGWFSDYVAGVDWQQIVSLIIVAGAAGALLWSRLGRRKFSFERDTHCGCGTVSGPTQNSIVFRARKGEPPQVVVKMK
jgi:hypothetical protein